MLLLAYSGGEGQTPDCGGRGVLHLPGKGHVSAGLEINHTLGMSGVHDQDGLITPEEGVSLLLGFVSREPSL